MLAALSWMGSSQLKAGPNNAPGVNRLALLQAGREPPLVNLVPSSMTAQRQQWCAAHQSPEETWLVLSLSAGLPSPALWVQRISQGLTQSFRLTNQSTAFPAHSDWLGDGDVTQAGPLRFTLGRRTSLCPGVTTQVTNTFKCELHERSVFCVVSHTS